MCNINKTVQKSLETYRFHLVSSKELEQDPSSRIKALDTENQNTMNLSTTKQIFSEEGKINLMLMKKIMTKKKFS